MAANTRTVVAHTLMQVLEQRKSLSEVLAPQLAHLSLPRERGLAQEMCYGVLRWHLRLEAVLARLLSTPFKQRDKDIHCLYGLSIIIHLHVESLNVLWIVVHNDWATEHLVCQVLFVLTGEIASPVDLVFKLEFLLLDVLL